MKKAIGIIFIVCLLPILFSIQQAIASEWNESRLMKDKVEKSIDLSEPSVAIPVSMTDRNGRLFAEQYIEWRNPLPLDEIPDFVQNVFLLSEDKEFYDHLGYDVGAIFRAFAINSASEDRQQGASTITQQVVRMRFLSNEKTYERKFKELLYAATMEKQLSKEQILEIYLNEMYFGNQVYGIGAAATFYFSRPLDQLEPAEMAFLAAIPNNPSRYDPIRHFDNTKKRQELLLSVLVKNGAIPATEAESYKQEPIFLKVKEKVDRYVMYSSYVLAELEDLIGHKEGFESKIRHAENKEQQKMQSDALKRRTAEVIAGGIQIDTALDPNKQKRDEAALSSLLSVKDLQAGAAVIDNASREVVSIYGGKGYRKADFNRAYQAVRQPGSAMKPLLVYAPYLESGPFKENTPIDGSNLCIGNYCPKNIRGYSYGTTTLMEAFRHSHNTTAVRVFREIGIENAFTYLQPFHFDHVTKEDHVYPAALGGFNQGVTPLELASAYTSFIDGKYSAPHAIRDVRDRNGEVLYSWGVKREEVWSFSTTSIMRNLMEDVVLNGTGRGITYRTGYTGAKTGTTDKYKDIWVAGLNDNYTAAVWIGYDKPSSVQRLSDAKIHLKLFNELLKD